MNHKDIKVGNFYHVLVKVLGINPKNGEFSTETVNEFGTSLNMEPTYFARGEAEAFFPITPENGTKNSEPAPKYDPCRKFREGDIVTPCDVKGRWLSDYWKNKAGQHFVVTKDESGGEIPILDIKAKPFEFADYLPAVYFELVTPVEELEPYSVGGSIDGCILYKYGEHYAEFVNSSDAEKACKLLNAEHRKEQR